MKKIKWLIISILFLILFFSSPILAKKYELSNYDIQLVVEKNGDYLITEKITFNFLEGTFTWASRDVKGKGFQNLKLISIEGINSNITDYKVSQGNNLEVKWFFPETTGKKTFIIKYKATGGLITSGDKNIVNWMAIGEGWEVPIHDIDIQIKLPENVNNIKASPSEDIVKLSGEEINFTKNYLNPGKAYQITLSFPLIIKTNNTSAYSDGISDQTLISIILGLVIGMIFATFDIFRRYREKPLESNININDLSFSEMGIIYNNGNQNRAGVAAQIFRLAKEGKIKLISKVKKRPFGIKNTEIEVKILSTDNLKPGSKIIVDKLKEHRNLKKFARDYKIFNMVHKEARKELENSGLISSKALKIRKKIFFSSLYFLPAGITAIIYGGVKALPMVTGLGIFLMVVGIGRLIKGAITSILSSEGMYIKGIIKDSLDKKKAELEKLINFVNADKALDYFFKELEFIIMHRKFNNSTLNKYKKVFKKAKNINIPDWIKLDLSNLEETIDALDLVEVIDYMMISMLVIASNTGAITGSTGTSGGGAAGGGGGAG